MHALLALRLVDQDIGQHIGSIERIRLPMDGDAVKSIAGSLPAGRDAIRDALAVYAPLDRLEQPIAVLQDQLAILERQDLELREEKRLRIFRTETGLKRPRPPRNTRNRSSGSLNSRKGSRGGTES